MINGRCSSNEFYAQKNKEVKEQPTRNASSSEPLTRMSALQKVRGLYNSTNKRGGGGGGGGATFVFQVTNLFRNSNLPDSWIPHYEVHPNYIFQIPYLLYFILFFNPPCSFWHKNCFSEPTVISPL